MSFPRAVIKRFNEEADATIPPLGTYDPKFVTDVAVTSSAKTLDKSGRGTGGKARSEGNEPLLGGRLSRCSSCTRKRSITFKEELPESGRNEDNNNTSQNNTEESSSKSQLTFRKPRSVTNTSRATTATPSSTSEVPSVISIVPLKAFNSFSSKADDLSEGTKDPEEQLDEQRFQDTASDKSSKSSVELLEVYKHNGRTIHCPSFIQEIQDMAENLHVEVSEYKRRLSEEIIRNKELEVKKLELEFDILSLKRELVKHESAKETWALQEASYKRELEELPSTKLKLEEAISTKEKVQNELRDLQVKCKGLKDTELRLKEKLAKMENEKSLWEKMERERALQRTLKDGDSWRERAEKKYKALTISQMTTESKDNPVEARQSDTQVKTDVYEVKLRELTQQRETLNIELDAMRQELEEGKAMLELAEFQVANQVAEITIKYSSVDNTTGKA